LNQPVGSHMEYLQLATYSLFLAVVSASPLRHHKTLHMIGDAACRRDEKMIFTPLLYPHPTVVPAIVTSLVMLFQCENWIRLGSHRFSLHFLSPDLVSTQEKYIIVISNIQ
jgi:hypothetical protein